MTNLLILTPGFGLGAEMSSSIATNTNKGITKTVFGSRSDILETTNDETQVEIDYDLGPGALRKPDFIAVARAKMLTDSLPTTLDFDIFGDDNASFTTPDTENFSISTLVGPRDEDFVASLSAFATNFQFWRFRTTAGVAIQQRFSKVFLGESFDMGREPILGTTMRFEPASGHPREQKRIFSLTWRGVTYAKLNSFLSLILDDFESVPIMLWDQADNVFQGDRLIHCLITEASSQPITASSVQITVSFEELI